jgi:fructose-1,6-bisphosphatase II
LYLDARVYRTDDLAPADEIVFAACGITTGDILKGVRYFGGGARTHSIVMTLKTGLIRFVDTTHLDHERAGTVRLT